MENQVLEIEPQSANGVHSTFPDSQTTPKGWKRFGRVLEETRKNGAKRFRIDFGNVDGNRISISHASDGHRFSSLMDAANALHVIRDEAARLGLTRLQAIERVYGRPIGPEWHHYYKVEMLRSAKRRAEQRGWAFALTIDDIAIPERCPVLGIRLKPTQPGSGRAERNNSPSLDRIFPNLGYIPRNVVVISWRANHLKGDATADELRHLAEWVAYLDQYAIDPEPA